ncbi:hypothetical protein B0H13DRAFT_1962138 [Mycena leptocephala]|nr:hypothetical protein B0H13DRAFT_1962138 [Mycena leptocephala]
MQTQMHRVLLCEDEQAVRGDPKRLVQLRTVVRRLRCASRYKTWLRSCASSTSRVQAYIAAGGRGAGVVVRMRRIRCGREGRAEMVDKRRRVEEGWVKEWSKREMVLVCWRPWGSCAHSFAATSSWINRIVDLIALPSPFSIRGVYSSTGGLFVLIGGRLCASTCFIFHFRRSALSHIVRCSSAAHCARSIPAQALARSG